MDAELVLHRMGANVVAGAERAVGIDQIFGYQEQRNPPRAGRRVRQPRQHEMNNIVSEVVLAVGDEDFLSLEPIGAVGRAFGTGAQRADIGPGLRLGELHRARPFAGHQLWQIEALERFAAVGVKRIDRRDGEHRPVGKCDRGAVPHLDAGGIDDLRQALAAPLTGRGKPIPAAVTPAAIGLLPARRHRHRAALERCAEAVASAIERRNHFAGETAGFCQDGLDVRHCKIAKQAFLDRLRQPGGVFERKADIG